jgi:Uncharacterized protein conserved in bacteria (DUF2330)
MAWKVVSKGAAVGALAAAAVAASSAPAQACGGFFCSQSQPVNQAAERIIFSQNGDGTVTAVIQILYEGPSENFSWLLPISSVPEGDDIAVASDLAFTRLQQATNPAYNLNVQVEGECRSSNNFGSGGAGGSAGGLPSAGPADEDVGGGVVVAASGVVGAFEWTALELDPTLANPADAAIAWLTDNGYDVTPGADALLGPYLADGNYLLALRLTKGSDSGSIRPIVLTYDADLPMIPIKLTAVAANENMGVMTWLLSDARAVPMNYTALELNEARINWFNASSNYNDVVTAAANDAGGQGFVTEFAGPSTSLDEVVWSTFEEQSWQTIRTGTYGSFAELFDVAYGNYQGFDGFWDAVRASVTLPANVPFADFQSCPSCYAADVEYSPSALFQSIEDNVIEPNRRLQALLTAHPYVTRLYSTLSAADMTVDPLFTFNADLEDVANVHTATRFIECNSNIDQFEANWRIELPQGGVVRGRPEDVGTWPSAANGQPANLRVLQMSNVGAGVVLADNRVQIETQLTQYNDSVMTGAAGASGGGAAGAGGSMSSVGPGGARIEDGGCSFGPLAIAPSRLASWGSAGVLLGLLGLRARRAPRRRR